MIYTVDDLCLQYLNNFVYFDQIKEAYPNFRLIAFTISNFRNNEKLLHNTIFESWLDIHKDWVEIAVHSYDHEYPPDGDREDEEYWIKKAIENLKPYLPVNFGYRSPGWQTTNKTEAILKKVGCTYIAYENKIKYLITNRIEIGVENSHLYDVQSINKIYEILKNSSSG